MKKMKNVLISIVLFAVIVSFTTVSNALTLVLTLNSSAPKINVGSDVTVTVEWKEGMQAADFILKYDNSKLEYQSSSISDSFLRVTNGEVRIAWFSTSGDEDLSKATFTFKGKTVGDAVFSTQIDGGFTNKNLIQPDEYNVTGTTTVTIVGATNDSENSGSENSGSGNSGSGDSGTGNSGSGNSGSGNSGSGDSGSGNSGSGNSGSGNSGSGDSGSGNSGSGDSGSGSSGSGNSGSGNSGSGNSGSGNSGSGNSGSGSSGSGNSGSGNSGSGNSGSGNSGSGSSGSGNSGSGNSGSGNSGSGNSGSGSVGGAAINPTQMPTSLPKAGVKNILVALPLIIVVMCVSYYKLKEYKDV